MPTCGLLRAGFAFALVLALAPVLRADDKPKKLAKADAHAAELMDKYVDALGGRERLSAIRTRVMRGTITGDLSVRVTGWVTDQVVSPFAGSLSRPMPRIKRTGVVDVFQKAPRFYAQVVQVNNQIFYSAGSTGTHSWVNFEGIWSDRQELEKDKFQAQSIFDTDIRWRERYRSATYEGEKELEGKRLLAVRVTPQKGAPYNLYFDPQTHLLAALGNTFYKEFYSDYREVSGVQVPFNIVVDADKRRYEIRYETYVLNQPIDDDFFDPAPKKK